MRVFSISKADYEKYLEVFRNMHYAAEEYVPTNKEIYERILNDITEKDILFLLWIRETGKDTEKNRKGRNFIKKILSERLIVEDI